MPALVLFGRRWLIASDDVPLPAAGLAAFHFVSGSSALVDAPLHSCTRVCDSSRPKRGANAVVTV